MKTTDIEKMLNNAAKDIVPDVLEKVKNAEVTVMPVTEEYRTNRKFSIGRLAFALSLIFVFLIIGGVFTGLETAEAERVYLDVNPSVELVLNYFGRVKEVNYYNADAQALFADYDVKGEKIEDVLNIFIESAEEEGYFETEDAAMFISVSSKNTERAEKNAEKYNGYAERIAVQKGIEVAVEKQNASKIKKTEADELNISVGKLKIIKTIIALDSSYTIDELKSKEMRELNNIYKQIKAAESSNNQNGQNGQSGQSGQDDQNYQNGQNDQNYQNGQNDQNYQNGQNDQGNADSNQNERGK